jgi:hypothetical protein
VRNKQSHTYTVHQCFTWKPKSEENHGMLFLICLEELHSLEAPISFIFQLHDQTHIQRILGQRMDLMFDAMTEVPTSKRCPTYGQKFTPAYNAHGNSSSHMD